MKVQIKLSKEDLYEAYACIEVDGKSVASMGACEPEDASLARDLSSFLDIPKLMKLAYEAGKNGEDFEILETEVRK